MIIDAFHSGAQKTDGTKFDLIASYTLIAGAFLLPFFFIPGTAFSVSFSKTLLLAGISIFALALWLIGRLQDGKIRIPKSLILASILLVLFSFLISALFSPAQGISLTGTFYELGTFASMLFLSLFAILGALLFQSRVRLFYLYTAILLSFTVIFVLELLRIFFGILLSQDAVSFLGKWNDLAIFAGLAILLSLITLEQLSLDKKIKMLFYGVLIIALATLSLVNFSLIWGLVGAFALIIIVYRLSIEMFSKNKERVFTMRSIPIISIIVLLISILFLISGNMIQGILSQFLNISQIEVRPAWSSTMSILTGTWSDSLIFGSGPNLFVNQWLLFKDVAINTSIFWDTDFRFGIGLLPTFAITTGLFGLIAWVIFLGAVLYRGARVFFSVTDEITQYFIFSLFALIVYLWIITIFYVPSLPMLAFAFLLSGCFVAVLAQKKFIKTISISYISDPRIGFASVLIIVTLLIGVVLGGYTVIRRVVAFYYFNDARVAFGIVGDIDRAEISLGKAINLFESDVFYRALVDLRLSQINTLLSKQDLSADEIATRFQELLGSAVSAGNEATSLNSTDYINWYSLARIYGSLVPLNINGAYESAKVALASVRERNPKNPRFAFEGAQIEVVDGKTEEARILIREALGLKNNYSDAIFLLAQLDIDAGNVPGAIVALEQAAIINPNNPGLFFRLGLLKYNEEDYTGAVRSLGRAVQIMPEYANARYFLGLSYYQLKENEASIAQFKEVQKTNPNNENVLNIIENLKNNLDPFADTSAEELPENPPLDE